MSPKLRRPVTLVHRGIEVQEPSHILEPAWEGRIKVSATDSFEIRANSNEAFSVDLPDIVQLSKLLPRESFQTCLPSQAVDGGKFRISWKSTVYPCGATVQCAYARCSGKARQSAERDCFKRFSEYLVDRSRVSAAVLENEKDYFFFVPFKLAKNFLAGPLGPTLSPDDEERSAYCVVVKNSPSLITSGTAKSQTSNVSTAHPPSPSPWQDTPTLPTSQQLAHPRTCVSAQSSTLKPLITQVHVKVEPQDDSHTVPSSSHDTKPPVESKFGQAKTDIIAPSVDEAVANQTPIPEAEVTSHIDDTLLVQQHHVVLASSPASPSIPSSPATPTVDEINTEVQEAPVEEANGSDTTMDVEDPDPENLSELQQQCVHMVCSVIEKTLPKTNKPNLEKSFVEIMQKMRAVVMANNGPETDGEFKAENVDGTSALTALQDTADPPKKSIGLKRSRSPQNSSRQNRSSSPSPKRKYCRREHSTSSQSRHSSESSRHRSPIVRSPSRESSGRRRSSHSPHSESLERRRRSSCPHQEKSSRRSHRTASPHPQSPVRRRRSPSPRPMSPRRRLRSPSPLREYSGRRGRSPSPFPISLRRRRRSPSPYQEFSERRERSPSPRPISSQKRHRSPSPCPEFLGRRGPIINQQSRSSPEISRLPNVRNQLCESPSRRPRRSPPRPSAHLVRQRSPVVDMEKKSGKRLSSTSKRTSSPPPLPEDERLRILSILKGKESSSPKPVKETSEEEANGSPGLPKRRKSDGKVCPSTERSSKIVSELKSGHLKHSTQQTKTSVSVKHRKGSSEIADISYGKSSPASQKSDKMDSKNEKPIKSRTSFGRKSSASNSSSQDTSKLGKSSREQSPLPSWSSSEETIAYTSLVDFYKDNKAIITSAHSLLQKSWNFISSWLTTNVFQHDCIVPVQVKVSKMLEEMCDQRKAARNMRRSCEPKSREELWLLKMINLSRRMCNDLDILCDVLTALVHVAKARLIQRKILKRASILDESLVLKTELKFLKAVYKDLKNCLATRNTTRKIPDDHKKDYEHTFLLVEDLIEKIAKIAKKAADKKEPDRVKADDSADRVVVPELDDSCIKSVNFCSPTKSTINITLKKAVKPNNAVKSLPDESAPTTADEDENTATSVAKPDASRFEVSLDEGLYSPEVLLECPGEKSPEDDCKELALAPNSTKELQVYLLGDTTAENLTKNVEMTKFTALLSIKTMVHSFASLEKHLLNLQDVTSEKDVLILHTGTWDVLSKTAMECIEEVLKCHGLLVKLVAEKKINPTIIWSGPLCLKKVKQVTCIVNSLIKKMCSKEQWKFVDNTNIKAEWINATGIWFSLKPNGTKLLFNNLVQALKGLRKLKDVIEPVPLDNNQQFSESSLSPTTSQPTLLSVPADHESPSDCTLADVERCSPDAQPTSSSAKSSDRNIFQSLLSTLPTVAENVRPVQLKVLVLLDEAAHCWLPPFQLSIRLPFCVFTIVNNVNSFKTATEQLMNYNSNDFDVLFMHIGSRDVLSPFTNAVKDEIRRLEVVLKTSKVFKHIVWSSIIPFRTPLQSASSLNLLIGRLCFENCWRFINNDSLASSGVVLMGRSYLLPANLKDPCYLETVVEAFRELDGTMPPRARKHSLDGGKPKIDICEKSLWQELQLKATKLKLPSASSISPCNINSVSALENANLAEPTDEAQDPLDSRRVIASEPFGDSRSVEVKKFTNQVRTAISEKGNAANGTPGNLKSTNTIKLSTKGSVSSTNDAITSKQPGLVDFSSSQSLQRKASISQDNLTTSIQPSDRQNAPPRSTTLTFQACQDASTIQTIQISQDVSSNQEVLNSQTCQKGPQIQATQMTPIVSSTQKDLTTQTSQKGPQTPITQKTPPVSSNQKGLTTQTFSKRPQASTTQKTPAVSSNQTGLQTASIQKTPAVLSILNSPTSQTSQKGPQTPTTQMKPAESSNQKGFTSQTFQKAPQTPTIQKTLAVSSKQMGPQTLTTQKTPTVSSNQTRPQTPTFLETKAASNQKGTCMKTFQDVLTPTNQMTPVSSNQDAASLISQKGPQTRDTQNALIVTSIEKKPTSLTSLLNKCLSAIQDGSQSKNSPKAQGAHQAGSSTQTSVVSSVSKSDFKNSNSPLTLKPLHCTSPSSVHCSLSTLKGAHVKPVRPSQSGFNWASPSSAKLENGLSSQDIQPVAVISPFGFQQACSKPFASRPVAVVSSAKCDQHLVSPVEQSDTTSPLIVSEQIHSPCSSNSASTTDQEDQMDYGSPSTGVSAPKLDVRPLELNQTLDDDAVDTSILDGNSQMVTVESAPVLSINKQRIEKIEQGHEKCGRILLKTVSVRRPPKVLVLSDPDGFRWLSVPDLRKKFASKKIAMTFRKAPTSGHLCSIIQDLKLTSFDILFVHFDQHIVRAKLRKIETALKKTGIRVIWSSVLLGRDLNSEYSQKASACNSDIQKMCQRHSWYFMNNSVNIISSMYSSLSGNGPLLPTYAGTVEFKRSMIKALEETFKIVRPLASVNCSTSVPNSPVPVSTPPVPVSTPSVPISKEANSKTSEPNVPSPTDSLPVITILDIRSQSNGSMLKENRIRVHIIGDQTLKHIDGALLAQVLPFVDFSWDCSLQNISALKQSLKNFDFPHPINVLLIHTDTLFVNFQEVLKNEMEELTTSLLPSCVIADACKMILWSGFFRRNNPGRSKEVAFMNHLLEKQPHFFNRALHIIDNSNVVIQARKKPAFDHFTMNWINRLSFLNPSYSS